MIDVNTGNTIESGKPFGSGESIIQTSADGNCEFYIPAGFRIINGDTFKNPFGEDIRLDDALIELIVVMTFSVQSDEKDKEIIVTPSADEIAVYNERLQKFFEAIKGYRPNAYILSSSTADMIDETAVAAGTGFAVGSIKSVEYALTDDNKPLIVFNLNPNQSQSFSIDENSATKDKISAETVVHPLESHGIFILSEKTAN